MNAKGWGRRQRSPSAGTPAPWPCRPPGRGRAGTGNPPRCRSALSWACSPGTCKEPAGPRSPWARSCTAGPQKAEGPEAAPVRSHGRPRVHTHCSPGRRLTGIRGPAMGMPRPHPGIFHPLRCGPVRVPGTSRPHSRPRLP